MPPTRRRDDADRTAGHVGSGRSGLVAVEDIGGRFLLRGADADADEQIELIATLPPDDGVTVVVVTVANDLADALWPRLTELLTWLRQDPRPIVLAMSGAGTDRTGRPAVARRIADGWGLTVVAPAGDVALVPGSLFVEPDGRTGGPEPQWWSFAPGTEPDALGPRWPIPDWWAAVADLASAGARSVLTHVPAGVLVRPAGTPEPGPDGLPYAVPAVPGRPSVLVGLPGGPPVTAQDLVESLSGPVSRPEWRQHPIRLVPSGGDDLLSLGQAVARELWVDVEVLTGLPVEITDPREAYSRDDTEEIRAGRPVTLLDVEGRLGWSPFVSSVLCRPPSADGVSPPPLLESWRPPVTGMAVVDAPRGVSRLSDTWRVAVTRAGLWIYPADAPEDLPYALIARWAPAAHAVRIDVGISGRSVDDEVWPLLDGLLAALPAAGRARPLLAVHGKTTMRGAEAARSLAARHQAGLEPGTTVPVSTVSAVRRPPVLPASPTPPSAPAAAVAGPAVATDSRPAVISPAHRSTDEERSAFRAMVGLRWDSLAASVRQTFSRLPAIGAWERAAAAVDLVAVQIYLAGRWTEIGGDAGPITPYSGDQRRLPYLACLASGLGRLPTYRGAVVRGADTRVRTDLVGAVLTEPGPVGGMALPVGGAAWYGWPPTATIYVIWSDSARRVGALLDVDPAERRGDVVFGPGSRFAVLDIRPGYPDMPDLVLLRELPASTFATDEEDVPLTDAGRTLDRLDDIIEAARVESPDVVSAPWPAHCVGPIGEVARLV